MTNGSDILKIGQEVFVHGYVDEIRNDAIIIKNEGGYFGTVKEELIRQIRPKGEWTGIEGDGYADGYIVYDVYECSCCQYEHYGEEDTLTNYCPNCGAEMRGR